MSTPQAHHHPHIEVYQCEFRYLQRAGRWTYKWRWRFKANNSKIQADGGQGYRSTIDLVNGLLTVTGSSEFMTIMLTPSRAPSKAVPKSIVGAIEQAIPCQAPGYTHLMKTRVLKVFWVEPTDIPDLVAFRKGSLS